MTIFAKNILKRIILVIVTMSILLTFFAVPSSYAKLTIEDGKFYYSGTTKGTYVATEGIFSWLINALGDIGDWLLGIMTLGFRMVFVGWTALIERTLSRALETTVERTNTQEELVESATDLSKLTDSTDNVTVEAIIYNRVPALDINFFRKGFPPEISGTGQELICEACKKSVKDCCNTSGTCEAECGCNEPDNCCGPCRQYAAALLAQEGGTEEGTSIVDLLRNELAKWYYLIRFFSFAAMLVLLIAIGIKMAVTNVSSDKALYKRMLVDWLVGFVIIFSIHYVMLFIITVNETLVGTIRDVAMDLNRERMANLSLMTLSEEAGTSDYSDQALEIKVYEEIRTRAYDAKLTVGLPALILYMTLVYFAIRYTIVYLRRYLTVMILTLMGPALGVSYAFQKVFHGKSPSLSKWLREYIMNVIIQTVHAILYAIFIAQALVLALDSLGGMVIGLVMMNYALKADKLFRKIFNLGGNGSLLDSTANAGDPESLKQPFNAIKSYLKADATKELGKTLLNTPYAKTVKSLAVTLPSAAVTGAAVGAKKVADVTGVTDKISSIKERMDEKLDNIIDKADIVGDRGVPIRIMKKLRGKTNDPKLNNDIYDAAQEVLNADTPEKQTEALKKYKEAKAKRDRTISSPTPFKIFGARFTRAIDVRNTFLVGHDGNSGFKAIRTNLDNGEGLATSLGRGAKTTARNTYENMRAIGVGLFGSRSIDPSTGELKFDKNGMLYNFSLRGLGNLDDSDVSKLKDLLKTGAAGSLFAPAAMFVGLGTFVAHPKLGLTLLASGAYKYNSTFGLRGPDTKDYRKRNRRYDFSRFSNGSVNVMRRTIGEYSDEQINKLLNLYAVGSAKTQQQIRDNLSKLRALLKKEALKQRFSRMKSSLSPKALAEKANEKRKRMVDATKRTFSGAKTGIHNINQNIKVAYRQNIDQAKDRYRNMKDFVRVPAGKRLKGTKVHSLGIFDVGTDKDLSVEYLPKDRKERRPYTKFGVKYAKVMKEFEIDEDDYFLRKNNKPSRAERDFSSRIKAINDARDDIEPIQILYQNRRLEARYRRMNRMHRKRELMLGEMDRLQLMRDANGRIVLKKGLFNYDMPKLGEKDLDFSRLKIKGKRKQDGINSINEAINKAIHSIANGKQIDISNERTYQRVLKEFEANLRAKGIIDKSTAVGSIFQKGKMRDVFEAKAGYSNQKVRTLDKFLQRTMSKEDAENVKKVLFGMMSTRGLKKDLSQITATEILEVMNGVATGKIRTDSKDGSLIFPAGWDKEAKREFSEEEKKKLVVIEKYLNALKDENGEYAVLADSIRRDEHYLGGRRETVQGVLERMLSEEYSKVGVNGSKPQFKIASIRDFDARNITTERLSPDYARRVNTEIQAAIASMMISNGRINIKDKKQLKELTTELTARLREQKLIASFQDAEVIFKKGTLPTIIQEQVKFIESKPENLENFLKISGAGQRVRIDGAKIEDFERSNITVGKLTRENVEIVNKEIQATLAELLIAGKKIDTKNKEQLIAITERLTERLKDKGILESHQVSAGVIFKKGKLEETIEKQVEFIKKRQNGLHEFLLIAGSLQHLQIRRTTVEDIDPMTHVIQGRAPEEVVKQIDAEIQAAVVETAAVSKNGILDVSDRRQYRRVVKELSKKLADRRIISPTETAEGLFKPGKLEEIIENQAQVASANPEETKAMARDLRASEPSDTKFVLELDMQDIEESVADQFSPEAVVRLNIEIQAALVDVAEGGRINANDKKTRKKIIKEISDRLVDAGIMEKGSSVEEIIKPDSLERIIEEESELTNAKMSALDRFLDTALSSDEKKRVREVVTGLSESERRFSNAEDIYDQAMAQIPVSEEQRDDRERMFAEEAEARGYSYDSKTHRVERNTTYSEEQQETINTYERFLVEIYREQGMIYDPKTGTLQEDPSKKKRKKDAIDVEATLETKHEDELTGTDYAVMRAEMIVIIEEMLHDGRLDMNSERSRDEVMQKMGEKAKSVGLIDQDERITDLFTRGSLDKVFKLEATRAQNEQAAREKVIQAEKDSPQAEGVMETIAALADEKKNRAQATRDIADSVQARTMEATTAEREEKLAAIEQYTAFMYEEAEVSRRSRGSIIDETETPSSRRSSSSEPLSISEKVEQILDAKLEEIIEQPDNQRLLEDIVRTTKPSNHDEQKYMEQKVRIVSDLSIALGKKVSKEVKAGQMLMSAELIGAEGVLRKAESIFGKNSDQAAEARKKYEEAQKKQSRKVVAEMIRDSGITGKRRGNASNRNTRNNRRNRN